LLSCPAGVVGKRVSTSCRYAHGSTPRRWHETTPRTDDYNERNKQFTFQIDNVTVERK
jgi:hypothetical protein